MGVQTGAGAEPFLTLRADVRLLSRVGPDVSLQEAGPVKGLPTDSAGKHRLLLGSPAWSYHQGWISVLLESMGLEIDSDCVNV